MRTLTDGLVTALAILATLLVIAAAGGHLRLSHLQGRQLAESRLLYPDSHAVGETGGGMANAIVGSGILLGLASLIGVPIGIGAGIFLAEFGRGSKLANAIRFTADVLNGVPSIVMGLAAYALIVAPQNFVPSLHGTLLGLLRRRGARLS